MREHPCIDGRMLASDSSEAFGLPVWTAWSWAPASAPAWLGLENLGITHA